MTLSMMTLSIRRVIITILSTMMVRMKTLIILNQHAYYQHNDNYHNDIHQNDFSMMKPTVRK